MCVGSRQDPGDGSDFDTFPQFSFSLPSKRRLVETGQAVTTKSRPARGRGRRGWERFTSLLILMRRSQTFECLGFGKGVGPFVNDLASRGHEPLQGHGSLVAASGHALTSQLYVVVGIGWWLCRVVLMKSTVVGLGLWRRRYWCRLVHVILEVTRGSFRTPPGQQESNAVRRDAPTSVVVVKVVLVIVHPFHQRCFIDRAVFFFFLLLLLFDNCDFFLHNFYFFFVFRVFVPRGGSCNRLCGMFLTSRVVGPFPGPFDGVVRPNGYHCRRNDSRKRW